MILTKINQQSDFLQIVNILNGVVPRLNSINRIARLYISKLKTIFEEVSDEPLVLLNSKNVPIYHFAFASSNATAKKIAADIIGSM